MTIEEPSPSPEFLDRPLAVITGASSGIGRELAYIAAWRGYRLLLVARNEYALKELQRNLRTRADYLALDLTEEGSLDRICSWLNDRDMTPEILINNAGFGEFTDTVDMNSDVVHKMISLNVDALTVLSMRLSRQMVKAGKGYIMNVASTAAFQPCPGLAVYAATKAYVLSFTQALHEELKGTGVSVTALCPGPTDTNFATTAKVANVDTFEKMAADPEAVARAGFNAMMRGEAIEVPGLLNKMCVWGGRFLSRETVASIAGRVCRRFKRDCSEE